MSSSRLSKNISNEDAGKCCFSDHKRQAPESTHRRSRSSLIFWTPGPAAWGTEVTGLYVGGVFQQKWSITQAALKMETGLVQAQCQGHGEPPGNVSISANFTSTTAAAAIAASNHQPSSL